MDESQISSSLTWLRNLPSSQKIRMSQYHRASLGLLDCSFSKNSNNEDYSAKKSNHSALLPERNHPLLIKNEDNTIINTKLLSIKFEKNDERNIMKEISQMKRKSFFSKISLRKNSIQNFIGKDISKLSIETEKPFHSEYFKIIERYFPHFLQGILEKNNFQDEISSMNSFQNIEKESDFTLEDMKFLKETIFKEKCILEQELKEVTSSKANIETSFKENYNKKWGKIRSTALAMGKLQSLKKAVNVYGTSINLAGFTADKLEYLEEIIKPKQIISIKTKWLIKPNSFFLIFFWAPVLLFLTVYMAFVIPYNIALFKERTPFDYFVDSILIIDIFLNFFIIYEKDSSLIDNQFKIAMKYMKSWFIVDMICLFPFDLIENWNSFRITSNQEDLLHLVGFLKIASTYKFLYLVRIIHIWKLNHVKRLMLYLKDLLKFKTSIFRMIFFLIQVTICVHIVGCLWLYSAEARRLAPYTWPKQ